MTADDLLNHFKTVFGNDRGEAEPVHHEAQTHAQGHEHNQEQAHPYAQTQSVFYYIPAALYLHKISIYLLIYLLCAVFV